jgi:DNA (cytosine-5)-methyltransferase 1
MKFLSLFSGIEASSVAAHPLGWECVAFSEIDPACCAVLAHHYPSVPNLGDISGLTQPQIEGLGHIDAVVFGSPCQDLSVAGKRTGMEGQRSGLFFTAMDILRWSRARYGVWENVPGAFSSNAGRDFASVVREMVGVEFNVPDSGWQNTGVALGPDGFIEWSVLDAQWFGVPQRRRRIFVVRDTGNWRDRTPVLFERHSLSGYPAPRREAGKRVAPTTEGRAGRSGANNFSTSGGLVCNADVAPTISARTKGGGGLGTDFDCDGGLVAFGGNNTTGPIDVATACTAHGGSGRMDFESETFVAHSLRADGFDASEDGTGRGTPLVPCLVGNGDAHSGAVAFQEAQTGCREYDSAGSLRANGPEHDPVGGTRIREGMAVRRLTPRECERLQGFPDDYTLVPYRNRMMADGPRYKMLGNSMAVPVMRWIFERIDQVNAMEVAA